MSHNKKFKRTVWVFLRSTLIFLAGFVIGNGLRPETHENKPTFISHEKIDKEEEREFHLNRTNNY